MKIFPLLCALLALPVVAADVETTQVFLDNGQLEYIGGLDEAANKRLFALYEQLQKKPTVLSIRSVGGEVNTGMQLGAWVHAHAHKLDVRVMEFCLSSCANYVFPAAVHKTVSNFAVVGYHGGPGKFHMNAETQRMYDALDPAAQKAMMDDFAHVIARDREREIAYLRKIGVRTDLPSLGQEDRYDQFVAPDAAGWTYSQEGFAALGVHDITVINPPWKPDRVLDRLRFVTIPVMDQLPVPASAVNASPVTRQIRQSGMTTAPTAL